MSEHVDANISSELISLLRDLVPEYDLNSNWFVDGGIYFFMSDFASTLAKSINQDPDSRFVNDSFNFINTVGESDNPEVFNIVHVGILEILYTEKGLSRDYVAERLSDKLRPHFSVWHKFYY